MFLSHRMCNPTGLFRCVSRCAGWFARLCLWHTIIFAEKPINLCAEGALHLLARSTESRNAMRILVMLGLAGGLFISATSTVCAQPTDSNPIWATVASLLARHQESDDDAVRKQIV